MINKPSLRAFAKQSRLWTLHWIAASAFCLLAMTGIANAQDKEPSTYSPEFCEFSITFPDTPYKTSRCEDGDENRCYDQMSYTQVFDLSSTVNFRVICNEVGEDVRKSYDGEVMQATLRAMTDKSVVKTFETSFREEEKYKQAGLVGEGKVGRTPTIYIAQLWIGDTSAFSVEAEIIGAAGEEADTLFSDILRSVQYAPEKPAADDSDDEEPEEDKDADKTEDSTEPAPKTESAQP